MIDNINYESSKNQETCVLIIGELYVHGSELNPPSYFGVMRWWRFEPQRIPIGTLDVFEVRGHVVVIDLFLEELTRVSWKRISMEDLGEMFSKFFVDVRVLHKLLLMLLAEWNLWSVLMLLLHVLMV